MRGQARELASYAAHTESVETVVAVLGVDVRRVEVQVASVSATVDRTRPVVAV